MSSSLQSAPNCLITCFMAVLLKPGTNEVDTSCKYFPPLLSPCTLVLKELHHLSSRVSLSLGFADCLSRTFLVPLPLVFCINWQFSIDLAQIWVQC